MYILTRYVIWEVLKFFLAALVALTLLLTLVFGMKEGLSRGLPVGVMLRIMPLLLPEMLEITIPVSMLFSVSSVFGRMTGANEIVALKSLGISPMAVVWPAIVLATFLSMGTVCMYELTTSCKPGVELVIAESVEEIAYSMLQKNRSFDGEQFSITVKRVEQRKLIQPTITIKGPPRITISAAEAEFSTDWSTRLLWLVYRDSMVDVEGQGKYSMIVPGETRYPISITPPVSPRYHRFWVSLGDIPERLGELRTTLRQLEWLREASSRLGMPESPEDAAKIEEYRRLIFRLRTEPYRRWANGFTCLCFALIGMPVAMLWRHADVLTNFFVCFLPILAIYYPLLMLGDDLTANGRPPILFWMSNAILVIPAVILLRRIIRH